MRHFRCALFFCLTLIVFSSCQKEISDTNSVNNNNNNNNGNGNNYNSSCNTTVMRLKKWEATFDTSDYMSATWNANNTISSFKMNVPLSDYRTANFIYQNNRIQQAVLLENFNNQVYDTAVFHYNADGKVDSMYLKNDDYFNMKLTYTNGKLSKWTRYSGTQLFYYWDVETDAKGNVIKAIEWWDNGSGFQKESTYIFTRDDRKNPLMDIAPYMFYFDDPYNIFWYWGPNNYVDQDYTDHSGTGIQLVTGLKYGYNSNCYPTSARTTISGQVIFNTDDFVMSYY
jgi:hypothetical protein